MSLISSINIAQQALSVNQAALSVISNNIANASTPGYSKLKANLASIINTTPSAGNTISQANSLGGVEITSIERYSDAFLQNYYRKENSLYNYYNQYSDISTSIQNVTDEFNSDGLTTALNAFYTAANTLSSNPNDSTARETYVQSAQNLTLMFNSTSKSLSDMKTSLVGNSNLPGSLESSQLYYSTKDANNLLDQISAVNYDIIRTNANGSSASSLLDQRDQLLTKLSAIMPINAVDQENGTTKVTLGNYTLIDGDKTNAYLELDQNTDPNNPVTFRLVDPDGVEVAKNINSSMTSGTMGAILDATGSNTSKLTITGVLSSLDTLASGFADVMNTIQKGDPNGDGSFPLSIDPDTGLMTPATNNLFTPSSGTTITAANIVVNPAVLNNSGLVAAGRVAKGTLPVDYQQAFGNNNNMKLVLASQSKTYPQLDYKTATGFLVDIAGNVTTKGNNIDSNLTNQSSVLDSVQTKLTSETGVNLDEELSNLIVYQRAYQASARVFNVCSSLLEELVNLGK